MQRFRSRFTHERSLASRVCGEDLMIIMVFDIAFASSPVVRREEGFAMSEDLKNALRNQQEQGERSIYTMDIMTS